MLDIIEKARREAIRWHLLKAISLSLPQGIYTEPLLDIVRAVYPDATHQEVRRHLDYLEARSLVTIAKDPLDRWMVDLTRHGIDLVEYTVEVEPGIARPTITRA